MVEGVASAPRTTPKTILTAFLCESILIAHQEPNPVTSYY